MALRTALSALAAGLGAFLVVGIAVTELAADSVEFSLFLGIPAGLLAGAVATTVVLLTVDADNPRWQRLGRAVGSFGLVFFLGLVVAVALGQGAVVALLAGVALGILGALAVWLELVDRLSA